jgi:hypothetical protein
VRGFGGFGSALVYVPLMSAVYGPRIAVPAILLTIRANIMMCLQISGMIAGMGGVLTADVLSMSVLVGVPFLLAIGFGASGFHRSSDGHYRRIAYIIIGIATLVSLPVFDGLR